MDGVDFSKTAADYGRHRVGFPDSIFDRLKLFGIGLDGQNVLDVGTGTGTLARGFARRGARVTGLDPSDALMSEARRLDREAGVQVNYVVGTAESTGLEPDTMDVISAGQCWHWFDGPAAARELQRVLTPAGRLVVAHFDWIPLAKNVVARTEELILSFNPEWSLGGGDGFHSSHLAVLAEAGFEDLESFSYDVPTVYRHVDWRGRIRASAGVGASLPADDVHRFDAALDKILKEDFPSDPLTIPHRVWAVVARAPTA